MERGIIGNETVSLDKIIPMLYSDSRIYAAFAEYIWKTPIPAEINRR
jgi:hypothetical protein